MDFDQFFVIAGTGSRRFLYDPKKTKISSELDSKIKDFHDKYGDKLIIVSGMAEGWDEEMAKCALRNSIPFAAIVPSKGYDEYYWGKNSLTNTNRLMEFDVLLGQATYVEYVRPTPAGSEKYQNRYGWANFDRNDRMVEISDYFMVYCNNGKISAGTEHCFNEIVRNKIDYTILGG